MTTPARRRHRQRRRRREADVEPRLLLVHLLRDVFGLTGTHVGCDTQRLRRLHGPAWTAAAPRAARCSPSRRTVGRSRPSRGWSRAATLHPLQQAFWDQHGLQCGFCTPGMIMQSAWLLRRTPTRPSDEIREGISGNLCRCTGYVNIVKAIQQARRSCVRGRGPAEAETAMARCSERGSARWSARAHRPPPSRSGAWATPSSARRIRASSAARASTSTTSSCPACSGWTSSGARTPTPRSRASTRRRRWPCRASSPSSPARTSRRRGLHWMPTLAGDQQMVLPVDTVMYQAQEVAAVVADVALLAADGVAAVLVDYEPLRWCRPVQGPGARRPRAPAGPGPDKQTNHIWHWESGDRAGTDAALSARRGRSQRGHLHPAHPRRVDRDVRLHRRLGPGARVT